MLVFVSYSGLLVPWLQLGIYVHSGSLEIILLNLERGLQVFSRSLLGSPSALVSYLVRCNI